MEEDGSNDGGVKSSTDKTPASKQTKRRINQTDHPCFLCFTQRKSGDAGRRWHHTTRGKEITQVSLCDKCYQQEYNGRKAPGAPLTQNVLAAKQLTKRVDVVASDSEADSASGLTEPQAKRQRTSKSSTQAPAGPLAHAESSRQESGKTAPEASESGAQPGLLDKRQTRQDTEAQAANMNTVISTPAAAPYCVSPAALASDASPQPQFPFLLFKQVAHDASKSISRSVIAASLGPQQLSRCVSDRINFTSHVTEPCRHPGAEAPALQTSVPEVDIGAETGVQALNCLANPVRLSLPEQLPPALPRSPNQTSQADPGSVGLQPESVQGSTCEAVCSELMQLHRHLLSVVMKSHESQLGLSGYKAQVAANMSSQETIRHEVLVLAEMLQVAEKLPADSGVLKEQCQSLMQKRIELQVSLAALTEAADELTGKQYDVISSLLPDKEDIIGAVMADLHRTAATL